MPYLRFLLEGGFCQRINQLLEFSRPFPSLPCFTSALSSYERPLLHSRPPPSFPLSRESIFSSPLASDCTGMTVDWPNSNITLFSSLRKARGNPLLPQ